MPDVAISNVGVPGMASHWPGRWDQLRARLAGALLPGARSARAAVLRAWAFAGAERPLRTTFFTPFGAGGLDARERFATFAAAAGGLAVGGALRAADFAAGFIAASL